MSRCVFFLSSVCIINRLVLYYDSIIIVIIIIRQFKEVGAVTGLSAAILKYLARRQQLFGRVRRRKAVAAGADPCDDALRTTETGREEEPCESTGKVIAPPAPVRSREETYFTASGHRRTQEKQLLVWFLYGQMYDKKNSKI